MDQKILAKWTEPELNFEPEVIKKYIILMSLICLPLFVLVLAAGWYFKDFNLYFLAIAILAFLFFSISHKKNPTQKLEIIISETIIQVGQKEYNISDFGGFWVKNANELIEVNLENKKPKLLPITFYYANSNIDEAKSIFLQFLPEVASRDTSISDTISKWLNW